MGIKIIWVDVGHMGEVSCDTIQNVKDDSANFLHWDCVGVVLSYLIDSGLAT